MRAAAVAGGVVSPGAISAIRAGLVAGYALGSFATSMGGISAGEFVTLFVVGVICLVAIVAADWINGGVRSDDDD